MLATALLRSVSVAECKLQDWLSADQPVCALVTANHE